MAQDVSVWSDDEKTPRLRLRLVEEFAETGLLDITEETTTSRSESAQVTEVHERLTLTPSMALALYEALDKVLENASR